MDRVIDTITSDQKGFFKALNMTLGELRAPHNQIPRVDEHLMLYKAYVSGNNTN